jgi:hypothetical protein
MQQPDLTKDDLLSWCRDAGLEPPRLYRFGFSHNNFNRTSSELAVVRTLSMSSVIRVATFSDLDLRSVDGRQLP